MNAEWHFVRHEAGQPIFNSLGSEHFAETDDDWRPGEVLVRECIQNSLDARHEEEVVSVHFQIRNAPSMSVDIAEYWFSTLWRHLRSKDCKLTDISPAPLSAGFVVVEDFGTRGLEGDVRQGGLSDLDNRFFNFFRAEGLSGNPMNGTSGGSWGVGKSVFNRCSKINAFLALTGRRADGDIALFGKSILRHHRIGDGREFQGLGQFGIKDPSSEFMVHPAASEQLVGRLVRDFGLTRPIEGSKAEPGLSIVIPYADPEITAEGIVEIVIREYFHPIVSGRLRVRVGGDFGEGRKTVDLSQDNLLDAAAKLKRPEVTHVLELAQWSLGDGSKQAYTVNEPLSGQPPEWSDGLLRPTDPSFVDMCQRFDRGEPVSIRVPLRVKPTRSQAERAEFVVYLQRDLVGSGYRPVFVRGCIVVPNARQRAIRNRSLYSLVTIDEGALAVMLRAAEPPAHTSWETGTANFRGRYEHGRQTIDFVVEAPKFLAEALSNARTERDVDVWADLFPSPVSEGARAAEGSGRKGRRKSPSTPPVPPPPRLKPFKIDELVGGFSVARDHIESTPLPSGLEVIVAYDTSRGNPFRRYDPADFKLQKLERTAQDLQEVECDDNRVVIRPSSDNFRIEIVGFDANRDLVVKVRTVDAAAGGES